MLYCENSSTFCAHLSEKNSCHVEEILHQTTYFGTHSKPHVCDLIFKKDTVCTHFLFGPLIL